MYKILGRAQDFRFTIDWKQSATGNAAPGLAQARQDIFHDGLRDENGDWPVQNVPAAAGGTSQLFFNEDKSPKLVAREILSKLIKRVLESLARTKKVEFSRWSIILAIDALQVVKVFEQSSLKSKEFKVELANAPTFKITKDAMLQGLTTWDKHFEDDDRCSGG